MARSSGAYTWDFPDVKFVVAQVRSLYDIGESNPVPASGL